MSVGHSSTRAFDLEETSLQGCFEVRAHTFGDERGVFLKAFHASSFRARGISVDFPEWCASRSTQGVLRGLHFQLPPASQDKLVYCLYGEVLDVAVDLRRGSPTYGCFETFHLDDRSLRGVFVPKGFAHGYATLSDVAVVSYLASTEYAPELDGGIRWDSLPIPWPHRQPILSEKDRTLTAFADFSSPWSFEHGS